MMYDLDRRHSRSSQISESSSGVIVGGADTTPSRASSRSQEVWISEPWPAEADRPVISEPWSDVVARRVHEISMLGDDFDSYGAARLRTRAVVAMGTALRSLAQYVRRAPSVSPTTDGGLLCEWQSGDFEVSLVSDGSGRMTVLTSKPGREWEGPVEDAVGLDKLLWQASNPEG